MEVYTTEEQQVEVIKSWWKENGTSVLAGTVIGLVGLFGWRYYNELQQTNQEAASQAYNAMTAQLAKGDDAALEQAKSFISAHQGDAYAELAALQLAAAAVKAGKLDLAAEQLTQVAANGDESIKPIAALRLARVLKDQGKAAEALAQLGKINNDAFKAQVAEVRGDVLLGQGKPEEARDAYQVAADAGGLQSSAELKLKMDDLALPAVTAGEAPDA
ncbi:YfgM family protein [Aeromonas media]|uniref:YfgM family protein n=1 Tax=Aeromonas media TaxID=651 RepID=UPI00223EB4DE|nr:tetratricopeptide repeat protein [Aeromonas media]